VRERYINKLDPKINWHPFTKVEDKLILAMFKLLGKKWSKISKCLNGRPENMVKNRFYSHIKKRYDFETEELIQKRKILSLRPTPPEELSI